MVMKAIPDYDCFAKLGVEFPIRVIRMCYANPWWLGRSGTCNDCGTMIELVNTALMQHPNLIAFLCDENHIRVRCFGCEGTIVVKR
jgi:hypothetical protein